MSDQKSQDVIFEVFESATAVINAWHDTNRISAMKKALEQLEMSLNKAK